jgi:hypothetical protein
MKTRIILLSILMLAFFIKESKSQCAVNITPQGPTSFCEGSSVTLIASAGGGSAVFDQFQNIYNAGTSARTLPGYSLWQSFTAGLTGALTEIDMGFFNYINGVGTLVIYAGSGTGGPVLQTLPVNVFCASGNCLIPFIVSVPVTAGQVYTFHFNPGAGIPDPYGVQAEVPGTYSGGQMALVDPSGTSYPGFDMIFKTWVGGSVFTYTWNTGTTGTTIVADSTDSYIVTATDNIGCTVSDTVEVNVNQPPSINIGNDTAICSGCSLILNAGGGAANYLWSTFQTSQTITVNTAGTYFVQVTDDKGCTGYDTIHITLTTTTGLPLSASNGISYTINEDRLIIHLLYKNWEHSVIGLFDLTGNIVSPYSVATSNKIELDLNNFPKGIYLLQILNDNVKIVRKIIN